MTIRIHHLLLLLVLGIAAFWYFGQTRPIEVTGESSKPPAPESCQSCAGAGTVTCSRCKGRPSTTRRIDCPDCQGSGRHHLRLGGRAGGPCQKCNGTGKRTVAATVCSSCEGKGQTPCPACRGTGKALAAVIPAPPKSVVMGYSPWEKALLHLRIPVNPNPCPQRNATGGYPIVEEYLAIRTAGWIGHVKEWGEFHLRDSSWRMTATVDFHNSWGDVRTQRIEFFVQNRVLATSRSVE